MEPKQKLEEFAEQQPDRYRYYITNEALQKGTCPHMEDMKLVEIKEITPVLVESGTVKAFGYVEYPRPLTKELEQEYALVSSSENVNHLRTAELSTEQNMNMIDVIPNNEPPRVNQGYTILESETVGHMEYVLAENQNAPQPYATWARNMKNDEQREEENFFWGHYFCDPEAAVKDLHARADEQRDYLRESRPSLLDMLRQDQKEAARSIQELPAMDHVKHGLER